MKINIEMKLEAPLELPIAYNHMIQSWIYSCIIDSKELANLHDSGPKYGNRDYKLFTFGPLEGRYKISGKRITFFDKVKLEIRVYDELFGKCIEQKINENGILLGNTCIHNIKYNIQTPELLKADMIIKMRTPMIAYHTMADKQTHYLNPSDKSFYEEISLNAYRKYGAATAQDVSSKIELLKIDVCASDKVITKYKGFIIEGYKGTYRLRGNREILALLYNVGLGSKNSQGFGMFDIVM